ncbi:pV [Guinea pig adenovirus 1]|uniref:PV n=1 Tax=Guinea pig adenovirus 1 TaxID=2847100 RepID=A0AC61M052_9ADEN|nr:pV [Guinea pig adenovirus]QIZ64159.1 pV [Guinea pig adenovirus 1]
MDIIFFLFFVLFAFIFFFLNVALQSVMIGAAAIRAARDRRVKRRSVPYSASVRHRSAPVRPVTAVPLDMSNPTPGLTPVTPQHPVVTHAVAATTPAAAAVPTVQVLAPVAATAAHAAATCHSPVVKVDASTCTEEAMDYQNQGHAATAVTVRPVKRVTQGIGVQTVDVHMTPVEELYRPPPYAYRSAAPRYYRTSRRRAPAAPRVVPVVYHPSMAGPIFHPPPPPPPPPPLQQFRPRSRASSGARRRNTSRAPAVTSSRRRTSISATTGKRKRFGARVVVTPVPLAPASTNARPAAARRTATALPVAVEVKSRRPTVPVVTYHPSIRSR